MIIKVAEAKDIDLFLAETTTGKHQGVVDLLKLDRELLLCKLRQMDDLDGTFLS